MRILPLAFSLLVHVSLACAQTSRVAAAPGLLTNWIAQDTSFATEFYVNDSGKPGPTVMIVGGAHGNEPAGAYAAEIVRQWPLLRGKLVVVPRANILALAANKRLTPGLLTNLNNLNRNYPRAGKQESARGTIASEIWSLALKHRPSWLLDLHEGYASHQVNGKSVGSSIIPFPIGEGNHAADLMIEAVNQTIPKDGPKFVRLRMPIDGSLARAGGEHLHIPSMTVETTSKQPLEARVSQHLVMVHRLLNYLDMQTADLTALPQLSPPVFVSRKPALPGKTRIALYKGPGTGGAGPPNLLRKFQSPPDYSITSITAEEIQTGVLTNFNVVIFAGGSGGKQAETLGEIGREQVRHFVKNGGGYMGICAGAYLATSGFSWSLGLINARTVSPKWMRGQGQVKMEFTEQGCVVLGNRRGNLDVLYANGPIVTEDTKEGLPKFDTLALFRTELAKNGSPQGVMVNSPAIFTATYYQGKVVCISPHPEQTKDLDDLPPRLVNWLVSREPATALKAE